MRTVAFITLGCKVNQTESESMSGLFLQRGYRIVDAKENADVYVINTCSVTHLGERKSRQMVRRAVRLNPDGIIAVTGCFSQIAPAAAAAIAGVDVVIGTNERSRIVDFVEQAAREKQLVQSVQDIMTVRDFEEISLQVAPGRTRAFLKIQDGCDNYCSYCIIPQARGHVRSRPLDSIRRESRHLADMGFGEIVLTGINLGAYGRENRQYTLTDAVKAVLAEPRVARVRLGSTDSLEISAELMELMEADVRLCPQLHLPLQSGEDGILAAMRRPYTTGQYYRLVGELRARLPELAVTTDIIVGFPGESAASFAKTLEFAASMQFAKIHVFPYSRRVGTPAASMADQVDEVEKKRRVSLLLAVDAQSGARFRQALIGKTLPVLIEQSAAGIAEGLTPNYQRVWFHSDAPENTIVQVALHRLYRDGLWGVVAVC